MLGAKVYYMQYDLGIENTTDSDFNHDKIMDIDRKYIKENGNFEYLVRIYQTGRMLESNTKSRRYC